MRRGVATTEVSGQTPTGDDFGERVLRTALAGGQLDADAAGEARRSVLGRWLGSRNVTLGIAGILLCILFSLITDSFLTEFNLVNMVRNVSLIGICRGRHDAAVHRRRD